MLRHALTMDMNHGLKKLKVDSSTSKKLKVHYKTYQKYYEVTNN